MAYSQKYTLVQFLEPVPKQHEFPMSDWPLHVTLADVFAIELTEALFSELAAFAASRAAFLVEAGGDGKLDGDENPVQFTLLKNTAELQSLHTGLIDLLQTNGAVFNTPEYTREGFVPHSTHQNHTRLMHGQQIAITELSLIDMFVGGDWRQRKVLKTFKLKA